MSVVKLATRLHFAGCARNVPRVFNMVFSSSQMSRLRLYLIALASVAAAVYIAVFAVIYFGQRTLLFSTDDGGALAAAGWNAIDGSERVTLTTSDGEMIAAWYVAPQANQPVFLFLHGKSGRLELKKWRWARIKKRGFGILALSYRGYPGSTGSPSEAGLLLDAEAAYAWLRERVPANRIVLHGLSLVSGVAVALAEKVEARVLVLEAPFSAAVDVAAERYPYLPVYWLMRDPFLSREKIARVHMPVLIAHGTRDTIIPFAQGKALYARTRQPKRFVAMTGSDHSTLTRDGLYPHIWRFLDDMAAQPGK